MKDRYWPSAARWLAMRPDAWEEHRQADLIRRRSDRKQWTCHIGAARPPDCNKYLHQQRARGGRSRCGACEVPRWASLHCDGLDATAPICMMESDHGRLRWKIPLLPVCNSYRCYCKSGVASDDQIDLFEVSE